MGGGSVTPGPPGDTCSSHRPGWGLPPAQHPSSCLWLPVFLSCCFMVSAKDQMLVASVTQGKCVIREDFSPLQTMDEA